MLRKYELLLDRGSPEIHQMVTDSRNPRDERFLSPQKLQWFRLAHLEPHFSENCTLPSRERAPGATSTSLHSASLQVLGLQRRLSHGGSDSIFPELET